MLGYKSWLDTRWRFLIGLAVLLVSACGTVFTYADVQKLMPSLADANLDAAGSLGQAVNEALEAQRTFRGWVWHNWFSQNASNLTTLLAALLGSGSPLGGSRGALFSLALPVSRTRWLGARAAVGLGELLALALLPSLALALLSPLAGERYGVVDAIVHGASLFVTAGVFFGVAVLLSTLFHDVWRPLLLTCLAAIAIGLAELLLPNAYGLFDVMSAATYFRTGSPAWIGLLARAAVTAALLYAAAANVERRDF